MKRFLCLLMLSAFVVSVQAEVPLIDRSEFDGRQTRLNTANYEAGNFFSTGDKPPTVLALGFIDLDNTTVNLGTPGPNDGDGLLDSHRVTLWRVSDQSKIAEVTVPSGTAAALVDGFRYVYLDVSLTLEANAQYMVSAKNGSADAYVNAVAPAVAPNEEFIQDTTDFSYYYITPSNQYPTTTHNQNYYYGLANVLGSSLAPYDPTPANGAPVAGAANGSVVDVDLSWKAGLDPEAAAPFNPAIKKHYVYLSDDQNTSSDPNLYYFGVVDQVSSTDPLVGIDADGLNFDGQYLWQVEEGMDDGQGGVNAPGDPNNIVGPTWIFDTLKSIPVITEQPQSVLAALNEPDAISITVSSISTLTYKWYKSVDNTNDTSGDDTLVGGNSPTLNFAGVQISDEGFYYCEVTNDSLQTVVSDVAMLYTKRLIGHWKMDSNLEDSSSTGQWDGIYSGLTPTYDAGGIDADALVLVNDANHVTIPDTNDVFNFYQLGLTVSCWVKTEDATWSGLVAKQDRETSPWEGFVLDITPAGAVNFNMRGGIGAISSDATVLDNQWHMVTATYDGATGEVAVYVDAELSASDTFSSAPLLASNPLIIGAEQVTGGTPYEGMIDDVQVYTYAKADTEVLSLYNGYAGVPDKNLCISEYASHMDVASETSDITQEGFEPDCKVNLYDFVVLASYWLDCGLYPKTYCQ